MRLLSIPIAERGWFGFYFIFYFTRWIANVLEQNAQSFLYSAEYGVKCKEINQVVAMNLQSK